MLIKAGHEFAINHKFLISLSKLSIQFPFVTSLSVTKNFTFSEVFRKSYSLYVCTMYIVHKLLDSCS